MFVRVLSASMRKLIFPDMTEAVENPLQHALKQQQDRPDTVLRVRDYFFSKDSILSLRSVSDYGFI